MHPYKDVDFLIDDLKGVILDYDKMSSGKTLFSKPVNLKYLIEKAVTILVSLNDIELSSGEYTVVFTQEMIEQEKVVLVNFYLCPVASNDISSNLLVSTDILNNLPVSNNISNASPTTDTILLITYSVILRDNSRKLIYETPRFVERTLVNNLSPEEMESLFNILMSSSEMLENVRYGIKEASYDTSWNLIPPIIY